jgi:hypothetical protein
MGKNSEAPRPQGGTSRHCYIIHIVPLNPAYKAGPAGHGPGIRHGWGR